MIAYWLDEDILAAEQNLINALEATFPRWKDDAWENRRISTIELENMLALVRVYQEKKPTAGNPEIEKQDKLLAHCGAYIEEYIIDGEENAKIYSKYAWIAARRACMEKQYEKALSLCEEAFERLRRYSIEYFMQPLLQMIIDCQANLGMVSKKHYPQFLASLQHLHEQFGEAWYPQDSLFYNCCQKSYHLVSEMIRAERYAQGMTQEELAENVYENPKEIAKIENNRSQPHHKRMVKLFEKLGLEKERQNTFLITDSFEVLELNKTIQGHVNRRQYKETKELLQKLEAALDMSWLENRRVIQVTKHMLAMKQKGCDYQALLETDWELLGETYRLSTERMQTSPEITLRKGKTQIYRAPLRNEALVINQIAILLKKLKQEEEAIKLCDWVMQTFEKSRIKPRHRYHSYGLLLGNSAEAKESIEESKKVLRHELRCRKSGALAYNYLTLACAMVDDSSNREVCRQMIKEAYYLFELAQNESDQKIVEKYYRDNKYGEDIED